MADFRLRFLNNSISGTGGVAAIIAAAGILIGILLFIWFLFWKLWTWVLPQVWATGPENFINPGYWLFVGMLLIVGFIANIFKKK